MTTEMFHELVNGKPFTINLKTWSFAMSRRSKNVGSNGVSAMEEISSPAADSGDTDSVGDTARNGTANHEADTQEGGGGKIVRNRANPPVYGIIGVKPNDAGMDLLSTFPTRHQMEKNLPMVKRMSTRHYESLAYVKIKYIDLNE